MQQQSILILNAGSSSLKFALFQVNQEQRSLKQVTRHEIEGNPETAQQKLFEWIDQNNYSICAAGHRVVHGGEDFILPTVLNEKIITQLERYIPLAPLHQPHHLAGIRAISKQSPELFQVACFDTAFHAQMPWVEQQLALPAVDSPVPIKRYGFHGLSYEYIARVLPDYLGLEASDKKIIVAHLGSGASLCALQNRKSIATTMGFSALDGLVMGTRCGNIDPGVILYLMTALSMTTEQVTDLLYHQSGLFGVSGLSADMRVLITEYTERNNTKAKEAIDLFLYRLKRELGGLVAILGGLDSLIFTAGIGEHAAFIREKVCENAAWLGITIDPQANAAHAVKISNEESAISVWVIPTDEERIVAEYTWNLLQNGSK